jgi:hypothetical protein
MLRSFLFFGVFLLVVACAQAQTSSSSTGGAGILYNRETVFNLKLTTNRGFAPGMEFGRLRTYYKTTYFHFNVGEIKHAKETRQSADPSVGRSFRPFVFGKQNNLLVARAGWGAKRYFTEKARTRGVAVGMSYAVGPTLGMLKPYYLALRRPAPDNPGSSRIVHEKYSTDNADIFLDNTRILGASPFTRGLGEIDLAPGAHATLALHLDWGAFDEFVKALEIGAMIDVFARNTPIMVLEDNNPVFFNFFVNLQLGKRK